MLVILERVVLLVILAHKDHLVSLEKGVKQVILVEMDCPVPKVQMDNQDPLANRYTLPEMCVKFTNEYIVQ